MGMINHKSILNKVPDTKIVSTNIVKFNDNIYGKNKMKNNNSYYKYKMKNFSETETICKYLNKSTIKSISMKNLEPIWIIKFRLEALKYFKKMNLPTWSDFTINSHKILDTIYYSAVLNTLKKSDQKFLNTIVPDLKNNLDNSSMTAIDLVID